MFTALAPVFRGINVDGITNGKMGRHSMKPLEDDSHGAIANELVTSLIGREYF